MKKLFVFFAAQNIVLILIAFFTICSLASCDDNRVDARVKSISGPNTGKKRIFVIDRRKYGVKDTVQLGFSKYVVEEVYDN